jgi:hypothetical protein
VSGIRSKTILTRVALLAASLIAIAQPALPQDQPQASKASSEKGAEIFVRRIARGTLMRAAFEQHIDWSHVAKGEALQGTFSAPVYAGEHIALPKGTQVRVTISSSGKVRDPQGFLRTVGRTLVRAFNPLEKTRAPQYCVTLSSAELRLPTGEWVPADARVVRAGASMIMSPRRSEGAAVEHVTRTKNKPAQILLLQLNKDLTLPPSDSFLPLLWESSRMGRSVRAYLLTPLSASESRAGDKFQAQLAEPVRLGDREFESGSLVEGTVVRRTPPRIFSRSGKLYLQMDRVTADAGERLDLSGTLSGAEADAQMRFDLDEEGTLRGRKPGLRNGLIDLGISYAIGKSSDDIAETPIQALAASMNDAAVANAARYIGLIGAVAYVVTRHGRDVRLPKYAEIEIAFGRVNRTVASTATAP